jgi:shikimate kinase
VLIQEEGSSQLISKEKGIIQSVANMSSYMPAQGGNVIVYAGSLKKKWNENCES